MDVGKTITLIYELNRSTRQRTFLFPYQSSYDDVKAKASGIYSRLEDGSMPCDSPWPKERVELFKRWMDEGMNP
jgi:hypothetical protein